MALKQELQQVQSLNLYEYFSMFENFTSILTHVDVWDFSSILIGELLF